MASANDPKKLYQRKTLQVGAGLLVATIGLDSWDAIAETGLIDDILTKGEVSGAVLTAVALGHAKWQASDLAEQRRALGPDGFARSKEFRKYLGARAIRRLGKQTRPSLHRSPWRKVRDLPNRRMYRPVPTDYGQYLGRAVTGGLGAVGRRTYASWEQLLLVVAPPGMGKTAMMLHSLIDAPGGLVAASTKPDLYRLTRELRAEVGPTLLFNPQCIGNIPGDFRWDPLVGCEHYQTATKRAAALVSGTKSITAMQEASWGEKCVEILAKYLMAARLGGDDLHKVAYWLARPDDEQAVRILRENPQYAPTGWAESLEAEMRSGADRMKASIWSLARGAVAFMGNPLIAAACGRDTGGDSFDVRRFALERGTLYLIGDDGDETIAPLLNALTTHIYDEVRAMAASMETGRLDPPFGFFLDELTKITPVPIDKWASDARAHGLYITAICQTFAQLRERWGDNVFDSIMTLFGKVILGGIQTYSDLNDLVKTIGEEPTVVISEGTSTSKTGTSKSVSKGVRDQLIIATKVLRELEKGYALVLIGSVKAVVVKFSKGQVRADKEVLALRKAKAKAAARDGLMPQPAREPLVDHWSTAPAAVGYGPDVIDLDERRSAGAA